MKKLNRKDIGRLLKTSAGLALIIYKDRIIRWDEILLPKLNEKESETVESEQVVEIIKESFYDLMSSRQWPFLQTLTKLDGLGDTNNPCKMRIPTTLNKVLWVKYNY